MLITINSCTIKPATSNTDGPIITISGQSLEELFCLENIVAEDFEPKTYSFVFHAANRHEMSYLWKAVKKLSGVSLKNKLDAAIGKELYLNASFLETA